MIHRYYMMTILQQRSIFEKKKANWSMCCIIDLLWALNYNPISERVDLFVGVLFFIIEQFGWPYEEIREI